MKLKTFLKVGLPILAVSGLALVIALPVALTARNHHASSSKEINSKLVTTTTHDIEKTSHSLSELTPEKIGTVNNVVKDTTVYDSVLHSLKLNKDEVSSVNYTKQSVPTSTMVTYASTISTINQAKQSNTWDVQITLKDSYEWNPKLLKDEKNSSYTIQGHTLTLKNVKTQFSTIGIDEQLLIDNRQAISDALNSIKDLANYTLGKSIQQINKEFIDKLNSLVPGIPSTALSVKLENNVEAPKALPMTNNAFVFLTTTTKPTTPVSSLSKEGKQSEVSALTKEAQTKTAPTSTSKTKNLILKKKNKNQRNYKEKIKEKLLVLQVKVKIFKKKVTRNNNLVVVIALVN